MTVLHFLLSPHIFTSVSLEFQLTTLLYFIKKIEMTRGEMLHFPNHKIHIPTALCPRTLLSALFT